MRDRWPPSVMLVALFGVAASPVPPERADLVIVNAHVWTVDDAGPEAEAVAVRGERIVLVGKSDDARRLAGPGTRGIDARGAPPPPRLPDGPTPLAPRRDGGA